MANSLFVSYDLNVPGQKYEDVIAAIKSLGNWAKVQKSFWFVESSLTAAEARDRVWAKMDEKDSLIVIDITNQSGAWRGVSTEVSDFMKQRWHTRSTV